MFGRFAKNVEENKGGKRERERENETDKMGNIVKTQCGLFLWN